MALADCPVAAKASDFAQTLATVNESDEQYFGLPVGPAKDAAGERLEAAWSRLIDLQEETMDLAAESAVGLAIQVTLAIDELVQLETMIFEADDREHRFKRLRRVLRAVLFTFDARIVGQIGIVEHFVGEAVGAQFRRTIGPAAS